MIPSPDLLNWLRELPSRRALQMLRLISALLLKHGEGSWDARLTEAAHNLDPLHGAEHPAQTISVMQRILGFFDDGPSLRELRLSHEAGHKIKPENVEAVNAYLGALITQLFLSARQTMAGIHWRQRRASHSGPQSR